MENKIYTNLTDIKTALPPTVTLVAVSKTYPPETILEAYDAGQHIFGENKVQELIIKQRIMPKDIAWHFIGHLQSNKVKFIAPFISLIHSVDNLNLLEIIDKEAYKNNRVIDCLLQFHISAEETKFGMTQEKAFILLNSTNYQALQHARIVGVMGMATFTDNTEQIRDNFRALKAIFNTLKEQYFANSQIFRIISMGMSEDYQIAIEEGSTMVRIGSAIFGKRG